jgi:hypothetical protein
MSVPNLNHEFVDAFGTPHTQMEMAYPDGAAPGKITLSISANRPPDERNAALDEYKSLAEVLKFDAKIDKEKGAMEIDTGSRSPEGLMLFMAASLEDRGLVVKGEAHKGIEAVLRHEEQELGIQQPEMSASMKAAMNQAHITGATIAFAKSGAVFSAADHEQSAAQVVPNVAEKVAGRGQGIA